MTSEKSAHTHHDDINDGRIVSPAIWCPSAARSCQSWNMR
jgi:hypothetical protein